MAFIAIPFQVGDYDAFLGQVEKLAAKNTNGLLDRPISRASSKPACQLQFKCGGSNVMRPKR